MGDYRKLEVWRKAHALALNAHRLATAMRTRDQAALRNQIIRAGFSVPANIVEGREQRSDPAFARFLRIALGSASELDYHLRAAHDIGAIKPPDYRVIEAQLAEVRMMLRGLINRVEPPNPERGVTEPSPESLAKG